MTDRSPPLAAMPPRDEWFAGIESAHNRGSYLRHVAEFMDFAGLDAPERLPDATPEQVEGWRDAMREGPLRAATVRRKLSALSSLFEDLVARGAARGNPVEGVERPGEDDDTNAAPVLTPAQARWLLDAPPGNTLKGRRDRAILAVLLYQGLTREELCGLTVGDLRLRDGVLHMWVTGNRGRVRIVAVHPETEKRIADYLSDAGHGGDETAPLFRPVANNRGGGRLDRALDPASVYRNVVRHYAIRSGLAEEVKGLRAHSLRATAASTALREGARPEAVRDWLGHASLAATALYYRFPASDRMSPGLRISYPAPGDESADVPAFLTDGRPPRGSTGADRPDPIPEF
ncbi:MAG: tyrosine-type recombinase/integrase [Defluviicoccus sp.]|nr:tyrosine-type recombinase/integrase [Defluviicoccus sp.]